jgi:Ca-activated chloride channel family protein
MNPQKNPYAKSLEKALSCIALSGIAALALRAPVAAQSNSSPQKGTIRVQTNLVNVLTTVQDADGHPVLDLPKGSFQILEEGVPQEITRFEAETSQPLDLALMLDTSLSTTKELKFETETAAHFIHQVVRPTDRLAVFEFSDEVTQLSTFSSDINYLQSAARRMTAGAGTVLYDSLVLGSHALDRLTRDRRRVIVLVTDAGETTSSSKFEDARRAAIGSGALLYSIVVRPVPNESGRNTAGEHALITITDSTGGALFYLDNFDQLEGLFERINRELRTQYLLSYYPTPQPPPNVYRHVGLRGKGGTPLHYRKEYLSIGYVK